MARNRHKPEEIVTMLRQPEQGNSRPRQAIPNRTLEGLFLEASAEPVAGGRACRLPASRVC